MKWLQDLTLMPLDGTEFLIRYKDGRYDVIRSDYQGERLWLNIDDIIINEFSIDAYLIFPLE